MNSLLSWFYGLSFLLFILVYLTSLRLRIQKWLEGFRYQAVEDDLTELYSPQPLPPEEPSAWAQRIDRQ